jgi:hypothetical protein
MTDREKAVEGYRVLESSQRQPQLERIDNNRGTPNIVSVAKWFENMQKWHDMQIRSAIHKDFIDSVMKKRKRLPRKLKKRLKNKGKHLKHVIAMGNIDRFLYGHLSAKDIPVKLKDPYAFIIADDFDSDKIEPANKLNTAEMPLWYKDKHGI